MPDCDEPRCWCCCADGCDTHRDCCPMCQHCRHHRPALEAVEDAIANARLDGYDIDTPDTRADLLDVALGRTSANDAIARRYPPGTTP